MNRIVVALLAGLTIALSPQLAAAKLACHPLAQMEQALGSDYGEKRQFSGRESEGIEYRLYVNAETGSWSWVGIPAGTQIGCLIFAGKGQPESPASEPSAQPSPPAAQF